MERLKERSTWEGSKIKGSRFIVNLGPVFSASDASQFLEDIRQRYSDAKHHCYAYFLSNGDCRVSDCGEPRGSAGTPILQRIKGEKLVDSMVIVTRYFGGTKLGVGGLIRAYGGAASEAIKHAHRQMIRQGYMVSLRYSYSEVVIVSSLFRRYTVEVEKEEYGEEIRQTIFISWEKYDDFVAELIEKSSNRIQVNKE